MNSKIGISAVVRMLLILFMFIIFIAPAFAAGLKFETTSLLYTILLGGSPEKNCLYDLTGMVVLQSVTNGVLVQTNPTLGIAWATQGKPLIAYIYTTKDFVDGANLSGYWAYHVGNYRYIDISGAQRNVYAFKMYDKGKGDALQKKLQMEAEEQSKISREQYEQEQASQEAARQERMQQEQARQDQIRQEQLKKEQVLYEQRKREEARSKYYLDVGEQSITKPAMQAAFSFGIGMGYDYDDWYWVIGLGVKSADYYYLEGYGKLGHQIIGNMFVEGGAGVESQELLHQEGARLSTDITYMGGIRIKLNELYSIYADYHNYRKAIVGFAFGSEN
jgi:hypothetical protein